MDETLVRWVLEKELGYLQKLLAMKLTKQLGTELTTAFGRLDMAYRTGDGSIVIIELETAIDSETKLAHALEQVTRYSKFADEATPSKVSVVLLYAGEGTPEKYRHEIERCAREAEFVPVRYSMLKIKELYDRQMMRITLNSGAALSRPVTLGVSSLSWLGKIMSVFARNDRNMIPWNTLMAEFNSKTNFYVLKRLAEDFELITRYRRNKVNYLRLTGYGERFVESMPAAAPAADTADAAEPETRLLAPVEQRRLLIEILLNNNFTKTKVNIFHFLRYINITGGELLPKHSTKISPDELQYLNSFMGSSYNLETLRGHFLQLFRYCNELGMLERIVCRAENYDKAMLTSLGSRVLFCFELNLQLARERHQIPLQIAE